MKLKDHLKPKRRTGGALAILGVNNLTAAWIQTSGNTLKNDKKYHDLQHKCL